jgi:hypothetical protein
MILLAGRPDLQNKQGVLGESGPIESAASGGLPIDANGCA